MINRKIFLLFITFLLLPFVSFSLELENKGLVCLADNNIYNSLGFWFNNGKVSEYKFDSSFGGKKNRILNITKTCLDVKKDNCFATYSVESNNILFFQKSAGLDVLINVKTLKLKWPTLDNYYVLTCKQVNNENEILDNLRMQLKK